MKKSFILSVAALAAFSVLSCQKETNEFFSEVTPEIENNNVVTHNPDFVATKALTFVGTVDDEVNLETKTSLDGTHVKWAASEGIYLFDGVAPRAFTSDNGAVASTVNFVGEASDKATKYYAVYPSGTLSTVGGKKVISTTIPTYQTATGNSFSPKANVAVAYSESNPTGDGALQFKNIGAVVKFKLHANNDNVRKVRLDAIGGEDLTGAIDVTFESDGTFSSESVHANSESCAILESATNLDPSKSYYFAIKPGTYAGGFRITLYKADGSFRSVKNTTSNTLARNDLMDFGTLPEIASDKWKESKVDVLDNDLIGAGTSYAEWSDKTDKSTAVYAGTSATGTSTKAGTIQIRTTSNTGIFTTTSGGKVSKVVVDWHSETTNGRTLNIYGKTSAYSSVDDLFSDDPDEQGTLLGTIVKGTSTELSIVGNYTYIGMCSAGNAMNINSISIYWGGDAPIDPSKIVPSTTASDPSPASVALTDGSSTFTVTSNVPWTIASNQSYASVSVSGNTVTVAFENLVSGNRNATITVTPSEGSPVAKVISQGADEYSLYSGTLVEGDYIIVYDGAAMNTTVSSDRLQYTSVTPVNDKIADPAAAIVWHIAPSGDYWTIYNAGVDKYVAGTGAKNKAQLLESGSDDKSLWSCSSSGLSTTYDFVNKANAAASVNATLRKNSTYGFACYAVGTGGALTLYKK